MLSYASLSILIDSRKIMLKTVSAVVFILIGLFALPSFAATQQTKPDQLSLSQTEASHFARLALEGHPRDASLTLLFGRILLRQGELADAERAFRHALDLGLPGSAVNPYLAEVAFRQRRFADIARHLQDESNEWAPEKLTAMVTFWT